MKTVLITGGTEGIGKASAIKLMEEGFNVSTFSRNKAKCDSLAKELEKKYSSDNFLVMQGDVTKEEDMKKVLNNTLNKFKNIDILFNNAGFGYFSEADKVDMNRFQSMIQTNIFGLTLITKLVISHMKKRKSGLIINLASISGKTAFALGEFYSATKFAVVGYSEGLRNEVKDFGIKVSTLCPGMIKTNFFGKDELERRKKANNGKVPKMLNVDDITRVVSLICNQSEDCDIRDITLMPF